jgi:hypothetical protein
MTRQNIGIGSAANDGTGDTLRAAGQKINENFVEIYRRLGGDSDVLSTQITLTNSAIVWEGTDVDSWETSLIVSDPSADRTITIPDATGNVVLDVATQTLTNKTLTTATLTTPKINDTSADHTYNFAVSELAANRTVTLPLLTGNDTFVFANHTQTLTNKTLTSPTLNSPTIGTLINDANGAEIIKLTATASAVNEITVANAASGSGPTISATGTSTNVDLNFASKGTGAIRMSTKVAYDAETLDAAAPAVSLLKPLTIFDRTTATAGTLADGTVTGETKKFININTGVATVTPASFAQGTSFSITQYGACEATWVTGSGWHLIGSADSADTYITIT